MAVLDVSTHLGLDTNINLTYMLVIVEIQNTESYQSLAGIPLHSNEQHAYR